MVVKITVDISLSDNDILIFRKFFTNKDILFNIVFNGSKLKIDDDFRDLESKGIVKIDYLGNVNLTDLGKMVFDQIER